MRAGLLSRGDGGLLRRCTASIGGGSEHAGVGEAKQGRFRRAKGMTWAGPCNTAEPVYTAGSTSLHRACGKGQVRTAEARHSSTGRWHT